MTRLLHAAVLVVALFAAQPALADAPAPSPEDIKQAADEFDQGKRAFNDEEFADAAAHFEAADRHAPSAVTLGAAIRSRKNAGQMDRAATLAALAKERHSDDPELVKLADELLKAASKELYGLTIDCNVACEVVIGTRLQHGAAREGRTVYLAPGEHVVRAGWSGGRSESQSVTATSGGSGEVTFERPPMPEKPAAPPAPVEPGDRLDADRDRGPAEESSGMSPVVFWIGTGLTVAAAGATAWSGIDTQNNPGPDVVRERCVGLGTDCPEYRDGLDRQRRTNILIGVTGGLGVATIVIGAAFTDWGGGSGAAKTRRARAGPAVQPFLSVSDGARVGAMGRF